MNRECNGVVNPVYKGAMNRAPTSNWTRDLFNNLNIWIGKKYCLALRHVHRYQRVATMFLQGQTAIHHQ